MTTRTFEVVLYHEPESGQWVTFVPAFDGMSRRVGTREQALADTRVAMERHLGALVQKGLPVPEPQPLDIVGLMVTVPELEPTDEDGLTVRQAEALRRAQELFAHIPPDVDLAGEIIAERREEARREEERERAHKNGSQDGITGRVRVPAGFIRPPRSAPG